MGTSSRLVASSARVVMVVRAKPARREDTSVDDEEWVVVKDRSIERGWGVSLFAKENGHSASEGAKRIDRALVKYGYARTRRARRCAGDEGGRARGDESTNRRRGSLRFGASGSTQCRGGVFLVQNTQYFL